jgi:uncharacterized membrane protein YfcA
VPPFLLVPIGAVVGLVGSLIGVGGGFFVVPFLLYFAEGFTPRTATATSLGVVLLSALSATVANARRGRIDVSTGAVIAVGSLPGAWAGRMLIGRITDRTFTLSFSGLRVAVALYLLLVRLKPGQGILRGRPRELADREGQVHRYETNLPVGLLAAAGVGVVSSLFGVGGGLVLVPFLVAGYGMPMLVATATAQFAFLFTAAGGLAAEALGPEGFPTHGLATMILLGIGVVAGAQAGVAAARRVRERLVRACLAAVILAVAAMMALRA